MKRDWREARAKCDSEGGCRVCGRWPVEAAHIIPRSLGGGQMADSIIPLCKQHHAAYDSHSLDILPALSLAEQVEAVRAAGGIERARIRICGTSKRMFGGCSVSP